MTAQGRSINVMARRILFSSQKGGVGKSTLARSVAVALACAKRTVLLADFDIDQGTCLRWQLQRAARHLEPKIDVAKFCKAPKLDRVSHKYDYIVMDTRGQHAPLGFELALSSDIIFLPSSFSLDDISPTLKVVEALRNAGIPSWRVAVVFCRSGRSAAQAQHARSIFEMNDVAVLKAELPQRDGFVSLAATGRAGREAPSASLRAVATAVDQAMMQFIEAATSSTGQANLLRSAPHRIGDTVL